MPHRIDLVLLATAVTALAGTATAATVATPETFADVLDHATPGTTVELAPGSYDRFAFHDHHWSPGVTVEAGAATLRAVRMRNISGLTWHGGTFDGGDAEHSGINIQGGDHLVVDGVTFHHYASDGIEMGRVTDVRIVGNVVTDSGSDGIDVALSQRVVIDHNRCSDFKPLPGAHADCIQIWSKPTDPPTADIVISNNDANGDMQGFSAFSGIADGGFDRITVEHNHARVTAWHGVALYNCRHCIVRHNRVESLPNPQYPAARAWIKVVGGADVTNCDNIAVDWPQFPGRGRCRHEKSLPPR